ncbi:NUDIX hydrolase [Nonomuraea sp. NPDC046802]|uniref:NUDIX hydrolase n=1 Tax=Nonomuraea sp. NPDC046802 TaxID=3154919 RepID=UPI0033E03991
MTPKALGRLSPKLALIRRNRPNGSHYTPPGGNVNPGEDLLDALRRELAEELRLNLDDATQAETAPEALIPRASC